MPLTYQKECFINGCWQASGSGATYEVDNPATGEVLAVVADGGEADAEKAVVAAHEAFADWSQRSAGERASLLKEWHRLILTAADDLAELMTLESGKPLTEAKGEVTYGANFVEWFAEEARRVYGDVIPAPQADRKIIVNKQPVGVCVAITPWNFPLAMITRKCAPALAAGCTVVVKPAEGTPLTALALADLAGQAGIPAGVFNVVTASQGAEVGEYLATHPRVQKISFTGSTGVGKRLLSLAADGVKRTSMELGGNAPFIVFEDADIDSAVAGAIAAKYRNTGQTCVCANRFLIHEDIYQTFADKLALRVKAFTVGNGLYANTAQGPLINQSGLHKVDGLVRDAIGKGATARVGGAKHALGGNFFQPTVLTGVTLDMDIVHNEIFGPVAALMPFSSEEDAIKLANDTPYGLAAYFYTQNHARIWRVAEALEYGMIGINESAISTEVAPFGGVKESGLGREGSRYGIDEYLDIKYFCMGGLSAT